MPPFSPLSDNDMLVLKKELNFLLWTNNPPPIPSDIASRTGPATALEPTTINMQCRAHAAITGILMHRRGYIITGRGGGAYVCDIDPGRPRSEDLLNMIAKHWWITANDELVDLSLYAESDNPLIFKNRSVGPQWQVKHKDANFDWQRELAKFQTNRTRGVLYVSAAKSSATDATVDHDAVQCFHEAEQRGIPVTFGKIATHCEHLLTNMTPSLTAMNQLDAWNTLRSN